MHSLGFFSETIWTSEANDNSFEILDSWNLGVQKSGPAEKRNIKSINITSSWIKILTQPLSSRHVIGLLDWGLGLSSEVSFVSVAWFIRKSNIHSSAPPPLIWDLPKNGRASAPSTPLSLWLRQHCQACSKVWKSGGVSTKGSAKNLGGGTPPCPYPSWHMPALHTIPAHFWKRLLSQLHRTCRVGWHGCFLLLKRTYT